MAGVLKGRYMADVSRLGDEVVVFVIGMRINKPLKVGLVAGIQWHGQDVEIPCGTARKGAARVSRVGAAPIRPAVLAVF